MTKTRFSSLHAAALLPIAGICALSLAGCQSQPEQQTYQADIQDESGGELIVRTPDPNEVPVTLPETPMTPVAVDTAAPNSAETAAE